MATTVEDEGPDSNEILALFKARRESKAAAGAKISPAQPTSAPKPMNPTNPLAPDLRQASPSTESNSTLPPMSPAPPMPPPAPKPTPQTTASPPAPIPPQPSTALATASPRAPPPALVRPGTGAGQPLTAISPVLNLSDRLLSDAYVTSRGWRTGRIAGFVLATLGLALLVIDRRATSIAQVPYLVGPWRLTSIALALLGLGIVCAVAFAFLPLRRRLQVRMAASQQEEWTRIQKEAKSVRVLFGAGLGLFFLGFAILVAAYSLLHAPSLLPALAIGALVVLVGAATAIMAATRRSTIRRLYVQTLVLARLESTGLGPAAAGDPRLGPVLKSLDQLLGALPESAVRRFLASDEAQSYLDLIEESAEDRHA